MASARDERSSQRLQLSETASSKFSCSNATVEWTLTDFDGINFIVSQLLLNRSSWSGSQNGIKEIQKIANQDAGMAPVRDLLEKARQTGDVKYLLKAYTVECDFYKVLNRKLAERVLETSVRNSIGSLINLFLPNANQNQPKDDWPLCFSGPIFDDIFSSDHQRYNFRGETYRGVCINSNELHKYAVGKLIFNKAFTSTSKDLNFAKRLLNMQRSKKENKHKLPAIFTFKITGADITFTIDLVYPDLAVYSGEYEVLIMPGIPFQIQSVKYDRNLVEVELTQYTLNHVLKKQ